MFALVPLALPAVPPLADLPGHIGRYRVMLGTDADMLSAWYRFEWRLVGNLGVDLIVAGISPIMGLEPAVKAAVMLIIALTVAAILWVSHEAHGRIQPWAFFALPLAYNHALHYGFMNHCLAMALALNGFALWLRLGRSGRLRTRAAVFLPISAIVWLAHVMGWGALCLMVYGAELARLRERQRWPAAIVRSGIACLPLAPPLVLLLLWRSNDGPGLALRFHEWQWKAGWFAMVFRDRWAALDVASVTLVAILLYHAARSPRAGHSLALTFACLLMLAAYLLMPSTLFMSAYADMRLAPYVVVLGLLTLRVGAAMSVRQQATLAAIGLAFFGVRIAGNTASLWISGRDWDKHLAALDVLPRGARLVSFVGITCDPPWMPWRNTHLSGLAIARRAAFSNDQWRLGDGAPLQIIAPGRPSYDSDPSQLVLPEPCNKEPGYRSIAQALAGLPRDRFDYVWLIDPPTFDPRLVAGMTPIWRADSDVLYRIDNRLSRARAPN